MSRALTVYLGDQRVGSLSNAGGTLRFTYAEAYLEVDGARPLSCALPIQREPHAQRATLAFFGGLLSGSTLLTACQV